MSPVWVMVGASAVKAADAVVWPVHPCAIEQGAVCVANGPNVADCVASEPNGVPLVPVTVMTPVAVLSVASPDIVKPPNDPALLYCCCPLVPPGVPPPPPPPATAACTKAVEAHWLLLVP